MTKCSNEKKPNGSKKCKSGNRKKIKEGPFDSLIPASTPGTKTSPLPSTPISSPLPTVTQIKKRSFAQQSLKLRCPHCGEDGHSLRSCPQNGGLKQHCGMCGMEGHDARTCQADKIQIESHIRKVTTLKGYLDDKH